MLQLHWVLHSSVNFFAYILMVLLRRLAPDYSLSKLAQKVQYSTIIPLL